MNDYSNREARIRLTPKCNYKCFFCHEEGGCKTPAADWTSTLVLLRALKAQGRKEITFTGGEPLLNKPVLLKCLAEIASWDVQPEVTLVTNAALLDTVVIEALERCARAKVHVSIHDARTDGYQVVTGQKRRTAEELKPMLKRLASGPVRLKLNAALTESMADGSGRLESLPRLCSRSRRFGREVRRAAGDEGSLRLAAQGRARLGLQRTPHPRGACDALPYPAHDLLAGSGRLGRRGDALRLCARLRPLRRDARRFVQRRHALSSLLHGPEGDPARGTFPGRGARGGRGLSSGTDSPDVRLVDGRLKTLALN